VTLKTLAEALGLRCLTPELDGSPEVSTGHTSDLLSDVLANAPSGGVWLTIQVHLNVVAVGLHAAQAAVVFTSGMLPEPAVVAKAVEEKLPLYATGRSTFDTVGRLYALGIRGRDG
jgi:hypothetical protein